MTDAFSLSFRRHRNDNTHRKKKKTHKPDTLIILTWNTCAHKLIPPYPEGTVVSMFENTAYVQSCVYDREDWFGGHTMHTVWILSVRAVGDVLSSVKHFPYRLRPTSMAVLGRAWTKPRRTFLDDTSCLQAVRLPHGCATAWITGLYSLTTTNPLRQKTNFINYKLVRVGVDSVLWSYMALIILKIIIMKKVIQLEHRRVWSELLY